MPDIQRRQLTAFDLSCRCNQIVAKTNSHKGSPVGAHELGGTPRNSIVGWEGSQRGEEPPHLSALLGTHASGHLDDAYGAGREWARCASSLEHPVSCTGLAAKMRNEHIRVNDLVRDISSSASERLALGEIPRPVSPSFNYRAKLLKALIVDRKPRSLGAVKSVEHLAEYAGEGILGLFSTANSQSRSEPYFGSTKRGAFSTSSRCGDQQGPADNGSVTKSMSRSTAPTSPGSRSA
jgi:hypothetical protein